MPTTVLNTQTKFGRGYLLRITGTQILGEIDIQLPLTMEFDIQRDSYASTNVGEFRVYNLSQVHRTLLTHDQWDYQNFLNVELFAGYGPGPLWPLVFSGTASYAFSVRQGTDFITTLRCFDGGKAYQNAKSNVTFTSGQSMNTVYRTLIQDLLPYGVSQGTVSNFTGNLAKGASFSGNTIDILRELSNNNFFIDNLKANVLAQGDAIGGPSITINGASGLLGTPVKENQYINFPLLFEPRLVIGSLINLDATTTATYNGIKKVISVHHHGVISAAVSGNAITDLGLEGGTFQQLAGSVGL